MTRHLLTAALPYANGSIHLGHLLEHIQVDIQARALRQEGEKVLYVCADDTHGTGVELNAMRQGITPEALVERSWEEHRRDFDGFHISHDVYYTTNSPENERLAGRIYEALKSGGHVTRQTVSQMYSESMGRFLTDRMVRGTCPKCGAEDQYGDVCEVCGSTYEPTDLLDPRDAIEGKVPVVRETEHLYVTLEAFSEFLRSWGAKAVPQQAIRNYVENWLEGGLRDWCISRDAPYFGFPIPGEKDKYFYVWLDAPVGYIAATEKWCADHGERLEDWWGRQAESRITHVIGKDIVYFHTLFWPAMLEAADFRLPERVQVHGMVTVDGAKMSKSRGTFINAATYLKHLDPEYLRFYFAAKLGTGVEDIDLSVDDFVNRVNADLINKAVNLCSRVTKFIESRFEGAVLPLKGGEHTLLQEIEAAIPEIRAAWRAFDYRRAMRLIGELSVAANNFMQEAAPWARIKEDPEGAHVDCSVALHAATAIMVALAPVTPALAGRYAAAIGEENLGWEQARVGYHPERVSAPKTLMNRLDRATVEAMMEEAKQEAAAVAAQNEAPAEELEDFGDEIEFGDFAKVDLRVGVVLEASTVEGADKLIQLKVDCGRVVNVFAGVRSAYPEPEVLVGKRVIVVANLKPRKMRFGVSEGMLLATSAKDGDGLQLVHPDASARGGWTVR